MRAAVQTSERACVHLVLGLTGAGKSTYAKVLQKQVGAIHLSVDKWMTALFGPDLEDPMDWAWISERAIRCESTILTTACELAQQGTSSILEIGLHSVSKRAEVAALVANAGCQLKTHFLDVDAQERWQRVQQRNVEQGETFTMEMSREVFDFFEDMWEAPSEDEPIFLTKIATRST